MLQTSQTEKPRCSATIDQIRLRRAIAFPLVFQNVESSGFQSEIHVAFRPRITRSQLGQFVPTLEVRCQGPRKPCAKPTVLDISRKFLVSQRLKASSSHASIHSASFFFLEMAHRNVK